MDGKIIPFDKLSSELKKMRKRKSPPSVVLCHGCFDIVHPGHIRHLKFARERGDFLIVSITPDVCVQKGSARPYVPQDLRAENLAALEIVGAVTIAPRDTALEVLHEVKPDIYVKGSEYAFSKDPRFLDEKKLVKDFGGKMAFSSGDVVFSSTEFIRDNNLETADTEKLNFICSRYDIRRKSIDNIINSAKRRKILLIGESIVDEYKHCEGQGIAQESPVLSISLKHKQRFVGGAGALALHLSSIGAKVTFITSVDLSSEDASFFKQTLSDSGVSLVNIEDKHRPLVIKSYYFVEKKQVMEVDNSAYRPLDSTLQAKILKHFKKEIDLVPDYVAVSDFGYGLLSGDLVVKMTDLAHAKNVSVASNITMALRSNLNKFNDTDILNATEMELRSCLHDFESGLSVIVDRIYSKSRINEIYMSLSEGSSLFFMRPDLQGVHNMESAHIPCLMLRQEDTMGRGEAFLAGVLLARTSGANEVQSIYTGAAFAAIHSNSFGNAPIEKESLLRLFDERKELFI